MSTYGNSGGKNKGKKYKKLTGYEVATPESSKRARAFMIWYGANYEKLKTALKLKERVFNDEIATDTALRIYDDIALKDLRIDSYKHYYFRAYHTNAMKYERDKVRQNVIFPHNSNPEMLGELPAQDFDYQNYEDASAALNAKILDHVLANYSPYKASIFEIYVGLQPDISCLRLAQILGLKQHTVWTILNEIRRDISELYRAEKDNLLILYK